MIRRVLQLILSIIEKANFSNVNDVILVFRLFIKFANGIRFTVYPDGRNQGFSLQTDKINIRKEMLESNLDFFESLKKVEKLYNLRFSNIGEYTKDDFNNVYKAIQFANGGYYLQDWGKELEFDLDKGTPLESLLVLENGGKFIASVTGKGGDNYI